MSDFDPYHKWLGIPVTERPVSKYRLLGIGDFESDREVISAAAERQTIYLRTLQAGEHEVLVAQLLNEVSQARVTLLNADQKAEYDEELRKQQTPEPVPEPTPPPIPVVQTPTPVPTPVVVRGTVTQDFPVSVVQSAKKPRRRRQQEIWKRPAVIGVSVVGVIGVFVLVISMMSSGDADPVASNTAGRISAETPEPEPQPQPQPDPVPADLPVIELPSIINTIGMTLNKIPAGSFTMGSPEGEEGRRDNETQHPVTITKAFYMQTTEVTQGQWKEVMGTEPWKGKQYVKEGPNNAASWVSWDDAMAYCKKLSEKESKTYRLPTEAEWEYACRAGTETAWSFGDDEKALGDYAWYRENAWDIDERYAHQVELQKPNAFGLYDMHGNVYEWCHDYYEEDYYKQSPAQDPKGPARPTSANGDPNSRVLRGGSWRSSSHYVRSANRTWYNAGGRGSSQGGLGFRVVRELD
jgi:formylglycine-generating enzyme